MPGVFRTCLVTIAVMQMTACHQAHVQSREEPLALGVEVTLWRFDGANVVMIARKQLIAAAQNTPMGRLQLTRARDTVASVEVRDGIAHVMLREGLSSNWSASGASADLANTIRYNLTEIPGIKAVIIDNIGIVAEWTDTGWSRSESGFKEVRE